MKKMDNKTYRDYIYEGYRSHLDASSTFKEYEKEKKMIHRYFLRNYSGFFPNDKNCRILDLGCGKGFYLSACIKSGYSNCIGIDLSKSNIDFCKDIDINCQQSSALDFLREKIEERYFFDVIMLNDVAEHLTKDEFFELIIEIKCALNENGIVMIKVPNMANPYVGLAGRYSDFTHEVGFTETSFEQIFRSLAFKNVKVIGTDIYVFNNPINYIAKLFTKLHGWFLYLMSYIYGRKTIRIFEKSILCVAKK